MGNDAIGWFGRALAKPRPWEGFQNVKTKASQTKIPGMWPVEHLIKRKSHLPTTLCQHQFTKLSDICKSFTAKWLTPRPWEIQRKNLSHIRKSLHNQFETNVHLSEVLFIWSPQMPITRRVQGPSTLDYVRLWLATSSTNEFSQASPNKSSEESSWTFVSVESFSDSLLLTLVTDSSYVSESVIKCWYDGGV